MKINTHNKIDHKLCGKPIELKEGFACVTMQTTKEMVVDEYSLIHGGFVFSLADHAAMLAVNHPNVVLGSASVKFLMPVKPDSQLVAYANVTSVNNKKQEVNVKVLRDEETVFEGQFICFVLNDHVLSTTKGKS